MFVEGSPLDAVIRTGDAEISGYLLRQKVL